MRPKATAFRVFVRSCSRYLVRSLAVVIVIAGAVSFASAELRVYPLIITPGSSGGNDRVFFEFDELADYQPTLSIFDVSGRTIAEVSLMNPSATVTGWRVSWDGRERGGDNAPPGVYLYQWSDLEATYTGAVVVAQ